MRLVFLALLVACVGGDPEPRGCELVCKVEADCSKACDPEEDGPDCSEQEKYDEAYAACRITCDAGLAERDATCAAAIDGYDACVDGPACGDGVGCEVEGSVYYERCVGQPGDLSCFSVCTGLEVGCLPYEDFGLRGGDDCQVQCASSAVDTTCMDVLFTFDSCLSDEGGAGYACSVDAACIDEAAAVEDTCDAFEEVPEDSAEHTFCAAVAPNQCACGLWTEPPAPGCEEQAENRCVFDLGWGAACRDAIEAFDGCLQGLDECTRDVMSAECITEWTAWNDACHT